MHEEPLQDDEETPSAALELESLPYPWMNTAELANVLDDPDVWSDAVSDLELRRVLLRVARPPLRFSSSRLGRRVNVDNDSGFGYEMIDLLQDPKRLAASSRRLRAELERCGARVAIGVPEILAECLVRWIDRRHDPDGPITRFLPDALEPSIMSSRLTADRFRELMDGLAGAPTSIDIPLMACAQAMLRPHEGYRYARGAARLQPILRTLCGVLLGQRRLHRRREGTIRPTATRSPRSPKCPRCSRRGVRKPRRQPARALPVAPAHHTRSTPGGRGGARRRSRRGRETDAPAGADLACARGPGHCRSRGADGRSAHRADDRAPRRGGATDPGARGGRRRAPPPRRARGYLAAVAVTRSVCRSPGLHRGLAARGHRARGLASPAAGRRAARKHCLRAFVQVHRARPVARSLSGGSRRRLARHGRTGRDRCPPACPPRLGRVRERRPRGARPRGPRPRGCRLWRGSHPRCDRGAAVGLRLEHLPRARPTNSPIWPRSSPGPCSSRPCAATGSRPPRRISSNSRTWPIFPANWSALTIACARAASRGEPVAELLRELSTDSGGPRVDVQAGRLLELIDRPAGMVGIYHRLRVIAQERFFRPLRGEIMARDPDRALALWQAAGGRRGHARRLHLRAARRRPPRAGRQPHRADTALPASLRRGLARMGWWWRSAASTGRSTRRRHGLVRVSAGRRVDPAARAGHA
jgi:hypothetical protein